MSAAITTHHLTRRFGDADRRFVEQGQDGRERGVEAGQRPQRRLGTGEPGLGGVVAFVQQLRGQSGSFQQATAETEAPTSGAPSSRRTAFANGPSWAATRATSPSLSRMSRLAIAAAQAAACPE